MKLWNLIRSQFVQVGKLSKPAKLFLLALLLDGLLISGWGLFLNFYILAAGFSRDFLGLINSMPSMAALIFGVPMGLVSDRIGRKRGMLLGFLVANTAMALMVIVRQPVFMLVMAFIWGAGSQLYVLSQAPFMMKVSDDTSRDLLFSLSFGVFPLASTLGNALAGLLPGTFGGLFNLGAQSVLVYQAVLLTSVLSSFAVMIPIAMIHEPQSVQAAGQADLSRVPRQSVWKILKRPTTIKLTLPNLITGFGAALIVPYFNVFFVEHHHLSDQGLGFLFSLSALLLGVATFIAPRMVGKLGGKIRMIVLVQSISVVFLLLLAFSPLAWLAAIGFLMRGTLMNVAAPFFDAFAMEQTPEAEQGAVNSVRTTAFSVGWSVGPFISGIVQERYGFSPLFIVTSLLYAVSIVLIWIFFDKKNKKVQPGGEFSRKEVE